MIISSPKHLIVASVNRNTQLGDEVVVTPQQQQQELTDSAISILIIDAICVVNMVAKTPDLTKGAHLEKNLWTS